MINISCDQCDKTIAKGEKYFIIPDTPVMCGPVKLSDDCVLCEACYKKQLARCGQKDEDIPEDRQVVLEQGEVGFLKDVLKMALDAKTELHQKLSLKGHELAAAILGKLTK